MGTVVLGVGSWVGPLLEKREKGRTPSCFAQSSEGGSVLYLPAKKGPPASDPFCRSGTFFLELN